jgi:hypothetical protein
MPKRAAYLEGSPGAVLCEYCAVPEIATTTNPAAAEATTAQVLAGSNTHGNPAHVSLDSFGTTTVKILGARTALMRVVSSQLDSFLSARQKQETIINIHQDGTFCVGIPYVSEEEARSGFICGIEGLGSQQDPDVHRQITSILTPYGVELTAKIVRNSIEKSGNQFVAVIIIRITNSDAAMNSKWSDKFVSSQNPLGWRSLDEELALYTLEGQEQMKAEILESVATIDPRQATALERSGFLAKTRLYPHLAEKFGIIARTLQWAEGLNPGMIDAAATMQELATDNIGFSFLIRHIAGVIEKLMLVKEMYEKSPDLAEYQFGKKFSEAEFALTAVALLKHDLGKNLIGPTAIAMLNGNEKKTGIFNFEAEIKDQKSITSQLLKAAETNTLEALLKASLSDTHTAELLPTLTDILASADSLKSAIANPESATAKLFGQAYGLLMFDQHVNISNREFSLVIGRHAFVGAIELQNREALDFFVAMAAGHHNRPNHATSESVKKDFFVQLGEICDIWDALQRSKDHAHGRTESIQPSSLKAAAELIRSMATGSAWLVPALYALAGIGQQLDARSIYVDLGHHDKAMIDTGMGLDGAAKIYLEAFLATIGQMPAHLCSDVKPSPHFIRTQAQIKQILAERFGDLPPGEKTAKFRLHIALIGSEVCVWNQVGEITILNNNTNKAQNCIEISYSQQDSAKNLQARTGFRAEIAERLIEEAEQKWHLSDQEIAEIRKDTLAALEERKCLRTGKILLSYSIVRNKHLVAVFNLCGGFSGEHAHCAPHACAPDASIAKMLAGTAPIKAVA